MDGLALEFDDAAIARVDAGEDLDQRGFSRAILAHQRMNLASAQRQARFVQRLHALEILGDALGARNTSALMPVTAASGQKYSPGEFMHRRLITLVRAAGKRKSVPTTITPFQVMQSGGYENAKNKSAYFSRAAIYW